MHQTSDRGSWAADNKAVLEAALQGGPAAGMPDHSPPALLTVTEFHRYYRPKIGKNTLYGLVQAGRIRSIRLGERKILIPATELRDWPERELGRAS